MMKPGGAFFSSTATGVHRTGASTVDHADERSKQLHAVKVLHKRGALDLLPMLFAPPHPTMRTPEGRHVITELGRPRKATT